MQPKRHRRAPALRRLLRSPKGYLLRYLFLLALIALPGEPAARAGLGILTATAAAVAVDLAIERLRNHRWTRSRWRRNHRAAVRSRIRCLSERTPRINRLEPPTS